MNSETDPLARRLRELPLSSPNPHEIAAYVSQAFDRGRRTGQSRPLLRPLLGLGLGTVAIAMVAIVVLEVLPAVGQHHTEVTLQPKDIMLTAARHAEAAPITNGRYWHTAIRMNIVRVLSPSDAPPGLRVIPAGGLRTDTAADVTTRERWVAASESDTTWFSTQFSAASKPLLRQADPNDWGARRFGLEGRMLTLTELQQLPTEPNALRAFLLTPYPEEYRRSNPVQLNLRLFGQAFELALAPVRPGVRAAAFRIMAELPGSRSLGHLVDAVGRSGVGVGITEAGTEHQLIIDPKTWSVIDLQDVAVKAAASNTSAEPGHHIRYQAILASGWTEAVSPLK